MTDTLHLIQERLAERVKNTDPEYLRLIDAYAKDPFQDIRVIPVAPENVLPPETDTAVE